MSTELKTSKVMISFCPLTGRYVVKCFAWNLCFHLSLQLHISEFHLNSRSQKDPVCPHFETEKGDENMACSGVVLKNFEMFGNVVKPVLSD